MQRKQRTLVLCIVICFLLAGIISAVVEPAYIQTGRYKFRPPQKIMDAVGIKPGMVIGKVEDPLFPIKNLDMIIMANVFHDLEKPLGFLENAKKYLKPEALLVIVDRDNSKLESSKTSNGMYVDPIFSQQQSWFWTGDKFNSNRAFVLRLPGALLVDSLLINFSYVRPVRTL